MQNKGKSQSVYTIADIGSNIVGADGFVSLNRSLEQIKAAASCGFSAVKFQAFTAETMLRKNNPLIPYLKTNELPLTWLDELSKCSKEHGVDFLCTPFYIEAVDAIDPYVEMHKIASWEITHKPLITRVAMKDKPIIMSTGASVDDEIIQAIEWIKETGNNKSHFLLHCTGGYPTPPDQLNLHRMLDLATIASLHLDNLNYGLSSHCTNPAVTAQVATLRGEVLEVHFDMDGDGVESGHSYLPKEAVELHKLLNVFSESLSCGCEMTLDDALARKLYRRDPSDWLRPVKDE